MSNVTKRNPIEREADNMAVAREIKDQDLAGKSGAGLGTAVQMTAAGKCGYVVTLSAECSSNHVAC